MSVARHSARNHPGAVRRTAQSAVVVALVGGLLSAATTSAEAATEQTLQAVDVHLGPDGSIGSLSGTTITQDSDGGSASESQDFDAADAADLPVRVSTTYRLDDRAGTDLSDIEGESGRVVIDITVQNTTVRPERVSYDAEGVSRTQYALIGAPLTVVASADLGDEGLTQVLTRGEDGTNGVLSQSADGAAQVQWASMLAPPRLAPSATFRLVMKSDSLSVPDVDLSVQPGLVTDTSVAALLEQAFADDAGSTVSMEAQTIQLVGDVNAVLTEASGVLGEIESRLGASADQLGARTIAELQRSSQEVTASLSGLTTDLDALRGQVGGELDGATDSANAALARSIDAVKAKLGDPDRIPAPQPAGTGGGCGVVLGGSLASDTVYGQLVAVASRLETLGEAGTECSERIVDSLREQIGSAADVATCTEESTSAVCVLSAASRAVGDQGEVLQALGDRLGGRFDESLVDDLGVQVAGVTSLVESVKKTALQVDPANPGNPLEPLDAVLGQLSVTLTNLKNLLGPDATSGLRRRFETINAQAVSQAATARSLQADLAALRGTVCAMDPAATADATLAGQIQTAQDQAGCATPGSAVDARLAPVVATLDSIAGLSSKDAVAVDFAAIQSGVDQALERVTAATNASAGSLAGRLSKLTESVVSLSDSYAAPSCEDVDDAPALSKPVDRLVLTYTKVACNQDGLEADLDASIDAITDGLSGSGGALGEAIAGTDAARIQASGKVSELFGRLGRGAQRTSDRITGQGAERIEAQRTQLDATVRASGLALDGAVGDALSVLDSTVSAANRSVADSESRLTEDLGNVLADLGTRESGGTGILGSLVTGATQTAVANEQISSANARATRFRSVRSQALADVFLQQAQMARALELQEALPAFGLDVPEGSDVLTVYSFHLGQD
ncbi:hypothetical protein [Nocardioides sp. Leaf307]|uniref:hypothetical protein n=1 Tax=Nocardioides sp. Leaf307 TaxID=1736331 RepID=UPI000A557505|nr:hypothetical protein [Nocardioides sp. Leaf307]